MTLNSYLKGDLATVHKPPMNSQRSCGWVSSMDRYDGLTMEVLADKGFCVVFVGSQYLFRKDWIEPLVSEELQCEGLEDLFNA